MLSRALRLVTNNPHPTMVIILDGLWFLANFAYGFVMLNIAIDFENQSELIRSFYGALGLGLLGGVLFLAWVGLVSIPKQS